MSASKKISSLNCHERLCLKGFIHFGYALILATHIHIGYAYILATQIDRIKTIFWIIYDDFIVDFCINMTIIN